MRKLLIGLTFLLCAGCNPTVRQVQVGELQQREAICGGAQRAFDAADVKVLEAQSSAYRSERSRTPSGVWKLSMFYCGIEKAIGAGVEAGPLGARRVSSTIDRWESLYPSSPAPRVMQASAEAQRLHGPLKFLEMMDWTEEPAPQIWKSVMDELDRHSFVVLQDAAAQSLLEAEGG